MKAWYRAGGRSVEHYHCNHKAGMSGMAHDFGFRVGARRAYDVALL